MISIEYHQTDYESLIRHFSRLFKIKVKANTIKMPSEMADGYIAFYQLNNGLELMIYDFKANQDILFKRKKSNQEIYWLRFDEMLMVGDNQYKSGIFLNSTLSDWMFLATAGTTIKSFQIKFEKEWLKNYLSIDEAGEEINRFLGLRSGGNYFEALEPDDRSLLLKIYQPFEKNEWKQMLIHIRTMILMERFFIKMYRKAIQEPTHRKISNDELVRLKHVEALLLADFSVTPPGINTLARHAAMSASKLKLLFKEIYGLPIYQYFQKHRMQKAKAMLLSKNYTLKTVTAEIGYSNIVNFSKAFKKIFHQSPEELIKR